MRSELTNKNVLIVVPAFNEALNINQVLDSLKRQDRNILVVNDGSVDATASISRASRVPVLDLVINLGVGGALRAGFQFACIHGYEAVIQFDADGQHSVDHIDDLIVAANHSCADMVVGSRFIDASVSMHIGGLRRLTMRVLARSASRATGSKITDSTSGFRLIRQPLLGKFSLLFASNYLGDTYGALIAAGRAGFTVREIPTPIRERLSGSSTSSAIQSSMQTVKVLTVAILQLHTRI